MSRTFYSEIYLHLVWHTKHSLPLLTPDVEEVVHRLIRDKACEMDGIYFHAIGGTETHVHVALRILPTVLISDLVGVLKGASARKTNVLLAGGEQMLAWQTGYGVVSFGAAHLDWVVAYIANQKEHHAQQKTISRLESATEQEQDCPS